MASKSILAGLGAAAVLFGAAGCGSAQPQTAPPAAATSAPGSSAGSGYGRGFGQSSPMVAKVLGITTQELTAEMKKQTLAQIATAHGISQTKVGSALIADLKSRLDQMVTAGRMDQATEESMLTRLQQNLTARLNAKPGQSGMMGGRGGPGGSYGGSYGGSPASSQ